MSSSWIRRLYTTGESLVTKSIDLVGGLTSTDIVKPLKVDNQGVLFTQGTASGTDAFGNLRTVEPRSLFEVKHPFGKATSTMVEVITGTATSTHLTNEASVRLRVAASGDKVTRRSKMYIPYEPGRAQKCVYTGILGSADTNVTKRIGSFDANDGFFFQYTSSGISVVERSFTSGSVVNTAVAQASWNLDKLDGTGPSGETVDFTKGQIFIIEYAWLGYGALRFGIDINSKLIYCHEFAHINTQSTGPYSRRGSLPVCFEIEATGTPSGNSDLVMTCSAIFSEGGFSPLGLSRGADRLSALPLSGSGTGAPLISVRLNSTYDKALLLPTGFGAVSEDNKINNIRLIVGGTLTGASWSAISDASEIDTSATAISGGSVISSILSSAGSSGFLNSLDFRNLPGIDASGNAEIVTVYVTRLQSGGSNYFGSLNFIEVY